VTDQPSASVDGDLHGRKAVVVGASSGIGRAVAAELTRLGARVSWCGRRADALAEAIAAAGGVGTAVAADIATEEGCRSIATAAEADAGGPIDLVVIASGASGVTMLRDADAESWDRLLRTNVVGPSLVVRHLLDQLEEDAVVAMLSSESVGSPYAGLVPYAASKAALEELIRGWRAEHPELRFARVTVGATDGTDFARDFDPGLAGELFPRWVDAGVIPARIMQAHDVGTSIAHTLARAVLVPGIDVQDLVLRSPGGPMPRPRGEEHRWTART
jgi:NAD(P)-dependent dehydrogenase (short-subunit alcohol dehydrogenase family)